MAHIGDTVIYQGTRYADYRDMQGVITRVTPQGAYLVHFANDAQSLVSPEDVHVVAASALVEAPLDDTAHTPEPAPE